jgi:hypothetical protein
VNKSSKRVSASKPKASPSKKSSKLARPRDAIEALLEPEKNRLEPKLVRSLYRAFNRTFYEKTIAALQTPDEARRFAERIRANREFAPIRADLCSEAVEIVDKPKHHAAAMEIIALLFDGPPPSSGERLKGWGKKLWANAVARAMSKARAMKDLPFAARLGDLVRPHVQTLTEPEHVLELARVYALSKRPDDAASICHECIRRRWTRENLLADRDLVSLHSHPDFKKLVGVAKRPLPTPEPDESDEELSMKEAVAIVLSGKPTARVEHASKAMRRESVTDVYDALGSKHVVRFMTAVRAIPDLRDMASSLGFYAAGCLDVKNERAKARPLVELLLDSAPEKPIKRGGRHDGWLSNLNDAIYYANKVKDLGLASLLAEAAAPHAAASNNLPHNAACAFAAVGRNDEALAMCRIAVENNYHDLERMKRDRYFGDLRKTPEFQALFASAGARQGKKTSSRSKRTK